MCIRDRGQYDFVITPQETRYVPAGAKEIIDIGQRVCDSSTMIEAALRLGLEELLESERFEQYQREVATNTYSFDRVFARGLRLESQFEMLMEILDEGIVGVNERGEVFACNRKLEEITFDEMLELASLGAQVLNNRSVELAKKYNVELEVLSSLNPVPGTVVKEVTKDMEGMLIKGVAKDADVAVITILNVPDEPGMSFKIFGLLAQKNINVDIILQSTGRDGKKDISFTCSEGEADLAMRVLKESAHFNDVSVDTTCAKVSIVGAGMQSHSGVASKMFEAMSNNNINIKMISTSEIKISCIIDRADADKAVGAIHDMLFD